MSVKRADHLYHINSFVQKYRYDETDTAKNTLLVYHCHIATGRSESDFVSRTNRMDLLSRYRRASVRVTARGVRNIITTNTGVMRTRGVYDEDETVFHARGLMQSHTVATTASGTTAPGASGDTTPCCVVSHAPVQRRAHGPHLFVHDVYDYRAKSASVRRRRRRHSPAMTRRR